MSPVVDGATTRRWGQNSARHVCRLPTKPTHKQKNRERHRTVYSSSIRKLPWRPSHTCFPPECYTVILFPCPQTHTRSAQVSLTGLASQNSPRARSHLHNRNTVTQCTAPGTVTGSRHHNPSETLGACRWDKAASWGVSGASANSVSQADAQGGLGAKGWPGLCPLISLLSGPEEGSVATLTPGTEAPRSTGRVFFPS